MERSSGGGGGSQRTIENGVMQDIHREMRLLQEKIQKRAAEEVITRRKAAAGATANED